MGKKRMDIQKLAYRIRADVLDMTFHAGVEGGHIGGAFSCADILAALYGSIMNIDPDNPSAPERDRFILSKGHVSIAHYAVLKECGFISAEEMDSFEKNGSLFSTHERIAIEKGIEITSGSLGYGISIGVGCALAAKRKNMDYRTFVLVGDGECNEGCIWEGAMAGAKYGLDNLIVIVDNNGQQLDGFTSTVMPIDDISKVFGGMGWETRKINGHNMEEIMNAIEQKTNNRPLAVIAKTIKGKGVHFFEDREGWHHARLTQEQYDKFKMSLEEIKC